MTRMNKPRRTLAALALLGCLAGAGPAFAQGYYRYQAADRAVEWYVDGGASIAEGDTMANFNNGWTVGAGVIVKPAPGPFMLRFGIDYGYFHASDHPVARNPGPKYGH